MKKLAFEYRITLLYIVIGALWITFSDEAVYLFTKDYSLLLKLSKYKGWFFVLVTGTLLFFLIKKEIKRRNLLYNELLAAKKRADEADRLKSAFLSNISHYIRTPMNSILGFIELLENKNTSPEKHQQFLKYINDRSEILLQTLNSIIEISKLQEGQYNVEKSEFKLLPVLNNIIDSSIIDAASKNIPVEVKFNFGQEISMFGDIKILTQIISSLISNAITFTKIGSISLDFQVFEGDFLFYLTDSGPGISENTQKTIFIEFMYNANHTYSLGEGAGLSLFLSYRLAKLLNGNLWLEKTSSEGTTFGLKIPLL